MRRSAPSALRILRSLVGVALVSAILPAAAHAIAGNGKLQIHHIDVGQGDAALLISPNGQTALFDDGVYTDCSVIKSYLQALGITTVDYHFLSHYHADHLGCIDDLAAIGITIGITGYDRGSSYSSASYTAYVNTLGAKRATMAKNQIVTLDAGAPNPVMIKCVDLNGAGVYSPSGSDENAKSMCMLVSYGAFQEEISGDLTGDSASGNDVESTVGAEVGDIEVYKAHHHGSRYSSNNNWLNAVTAEVCVISCGDGNSYGHPTLDALTRMHNHGIHTYWTETGAGATPNPTWDKVAHSTIVIQADPGDAAAYTVSGPGFSDTYFNSGGTPPPPPIHTTEYPSSLTMLKGSLSTGDVTRLQVSDNSRIGVSAGVSGSQFYADWYASVFLLHPPLNLTVTSENSFTVTRTQTLYAYNWTTAAWDQVNSASVGTTDVTKTWTPASVANYVGPSNEVRFRVKGNNRNSTYTSRGDFMKFEYDYSAGTAPMAVSASEPHAGVEHDVTVAAFASSDGLLGAPGTIAQVTDGEALLRVAPQAVLTRVSSSPGPSGVELTWAASARDHVDGFNVYRATGHALVFAGSEASVAIEGDEAVFRFVDRDGALDGVYWLGSRSCSGTESLLGPINVEGSAVVGRLDLNVSPNPAVERTQLEFALDRDADVKLEVYDLQGRHVATPLAGRQHAGTVQAGWDLRDDSGRHVEPGLYFARLRALGRTQFVRVTVAGR